MSIQLNVQMNGSYTKIPTGIIEDFNLDAHMLVILVSLYRIKNQENTLCQSSYESLASQSRCSKDITIRTLKKLEEQDYIQMLENNQESFCLSIQDKYSA